MNFLKVIVLSLCLFVSYENASYAIDALSQQMVTCCCEETSHSDSCSECPEEVATDYCGCKDLSMTFISPEMLAADFQYHEMQHFIQFKPTPLSWVGQPESPPPRHV